MSNKNICLLGIILGICGSVIIADWQSVWGDPCDQYSYERLKTMFSNVTNSDSCGGGGDNETLPGVSCCVTIVLDIPFMHYCIIQYFIAIGFCSFVHKMCVIVMYSSVCVYWLCEFNQLLVMYFTLCIYIPRFVLACVMQCLYQQRSPQLHHSPECGH